MQLIKPTILLATAISISLLLPGCSTARKIHTTLAANEVLVQAGAAEDAGDYEKAYELWTDYVEMRPHEAMGEYRLGRIENRLGKHRDAAHHLRIAHDLKPGNTEYIEELARALANMGEHAQLMSLLQATVDEGEEGSGYLRLARHASQAGMMDEAREALMSATSIYGGTSQAPHLASADFAREIGDTQAEVLALRHALWFDLDNRTLAARIRELGVVPGPSLALDPR